MNSSHNGCLLIYGILFAVGFAFCLSSAKAQAPPVLEKRGMPGNGVVLIATLQKNGIVPGEHVALRLRTRNEGQQEQAFLEAWSTATYNLTVEDENGHLVQPKAQPGDPGGSSHMTGLAPNKEILSQFPLSRQYDLTGIGLYRITVMRKILAPDIKNTIDVVSNTVILHVSDRLSTDFTLTSLAKQISVARGEPVDVQFVLNNISTNPAPLSLAGPACGYTLEMQDFRGEILPPKPGVTISGPPITRITLPPGEGLACTVRLSELYDLSKGGRYFVTAMREVPAAGGKTAEIYSPTVIITITAPVKN